MEPFYCDDNEIDDPTFIIKADMDDTGNLEETDYVIEEEIADFEEADRSNAKGKNQ